MNDIEEMNVLKQVAKDVIIYENKSKKGILKDIIKRIDDLEKKKLKMEMTIFLLRKMKRRYSNREKELLEEIFSTYNKSIEPSVLHSLYEEIILEQT